MFYYPLNYDQINVMAGTYNPSPVKAYNNETFAFWERALFQRAASRVRFKLPDDWNGSIMDFFKYCMFRFGYVAVFERPEFGKVFNPAALTGYDFYYRFTRAIISNPSLQGGSLELEIGKDCELLKLTPDYIGVWDIISYYAEKLSTLDNAINMSLINNKYAFMLAAKNKAAAEALKKMLDKINKGEPAVIVDARLANDPNDKSEPWQYWNRQNLKDSYLTTQQLQDFRTLLNNFDSEIGIPTLPTEKKERMISDEARATQLDSMSRVSVWLETFNQSAIAVNEHFGLNISAELAEYEEGGESNGEADNDRDVSI